MYFWFPIKMKLKAATIFAVCYGSVFESRRVCRQCAYLEQ